MSPHLESQSLIVKGYVPSIMVYILLGIVAHCFWLLGFPGCLYMVLKKLHMRSLDEG